MYRRATCFCVVAVDRALPTRYSNCLFDLRRGAAMSATAGKATPAPLTCKLDFARETSRRGARVYPMSPNSDQPAFPEADCCATTDEGQIIEWWREDPDCNVGIATD